MVTTSMEAFFKRENPAQPPSPTRRRYHSPLLVCSKGALIKKKNPPFFFVCERVWRALSRSWISWVWAPSPHYGFSCPRDWFCLPGTSFPGKAPPHHLSLLSCVCFFRGVPSKFWDLVDMLSCPHFGLYCSRDWFLARVTAPPGKVPLLFSLFVWDRLGWQSSPSLRPVLLPRLALTWVTFFRGQVPL